MLQLGAAISLENTLNLGIRLSQNIQSDAEDLENYNVLEAWAELA